MMRCRFSSGLAPRMVDGCFAPSWLLVLMGRGMGKMPMVRETGEEVVGWSSAPHSPVVGSHGQRDGEVADGLVNGQGGCWLVMH